MEIPVLIEPLTDRNGCRATVGSPLSLSADGETRDDAIAKLKSLTKDRLGLNGEVRAMDVRAADISSQSTQFLPDDALTREWMEIMNERRRLANESPDGLLPEV